MDQSESLWQFMHQQSAKLLQQTIQHIGLTFISLLIAVLIGLPLGIYITRHKRAAGLVLGIAGVLQTIPSIALLGFMIPLLGIGPLPSKGIIKPSRAILGMVCNTPAIPSTRPAARL